MGCAIVPSFNVYSLACHGYSLSTQLPDSEEQSISKTCYVLLAVATFPYCEVLNWSESYPKMKLKGDIINCPPQDLPFLFLFQPTQSLYMVGGAVCESDSCQYNLELVGLMRRGQGCYRVCREHRHFWQRSPWAKSPDTLPKQRRLVNVVFFKGR